MVSRKRRLELKKKRKKKKKQGIRFLPETFYLDDRKNVKAMVLGKIVPVEKQPIDFLGGDILVKRPPRVGTKGTLSFFFYELDGRRILELPTLYVPPVERGKGHAQRLVKRAIEIGKHSGVDAIQATTRLNPRFAEMLWILEKNGFKIVSSNKRHPDLVRMEKKLK